MKLNQKLIEKLRNGEIAVENSGTVEQLREVIKEAFPKDDSPYGSHRFYFMRVVNTGEWDWNNKTNLPTISVTDFYDPELFTGWAKDDEFEEFMFYFKDDVAKFGFNAFGLWQEGCEDNYSEDKHNRPATHEEIETTLIEEAKRRGYKKGVTCLFGKDKEKRTIDGDNIKYLIGVDGIGFLCMDMDVIFNEKNGQWAEIVEKPQPKKSTAINYLVDGVEYSFNYQDLKEKYLEVVNYSDEVFMDNLPEIAHLACVVSYFKGLGNSATISDKGIIHELIHLMTEPNEPTNDLAEIREKFNKLIQLV